MKYLIIVLCLFGCAKKGLDSLIGQSKHSLILQYGLPTKSEPYNNGEILLYSFKRVVPSQTNSGNYYWDNRTFFIDSAGIVYHWTRNKTPIPPEQIDLRIGIKP